MPYPESCPECGGQFRNTGTHFTARRNEVGRHVLLELGCQNASTRFWWDFTTGQIAEDGRPIPATRIEAVVEAAVGVQSNGVAHLPATNGHEPLAAHEPLGLLKMPDAPPPPPAEEEVMLTPETPAPPTTWEQPTALKDAFVRQLQLDRLTLRQMRSLFMTDDARRAIEVAVGATEATYERLALILFGADLPELLGKPAGSPAAPTMSAEERLELQREKARIRARLRRAAIKAARQPETA